LRGKGRFQRREYMDLRRYWIKVNLSLLLILFGIFIHKDAISINKNPKDLILLVKLFNKQDISLFNQILKDSDM